ncbi:MAG TPA: class I adenylate-forming enzyme family protein [Polyangiales bacterium]|nr:class I adenylate-forming enzyme family protein [Polyangiales bacterium]
MNHAEAAAILQAAGSPFELATETVNGRTAKVFKTRERSMREKIANATVHGDKIFLVYGDWRITFTEFIEYVWGAAHVLEDDFGVKRHDRIAILAYNRPEWLIALFGGASIAAISVGLNGWWTTDEVLYGLNDSGARYLIVDDLLWERVKPILPQAKSLETIFYIGDNPPEGTVSIKKLLVRRTDAPTAPLEEDDPFVLLYTSGTTGRAKGCITTHRGTVAQVQGIFYNTFVHLLFKSAKEGTPPTLPAAPATLLTSPLFHVAGLHSTVCASITAGSKLVFGPPKFDPEFALKTLQDEQVTSWMAIPTLLQRLLDYPKLQDYDLTSLTMISTGGAPTAPETVEKAHSLLKTKPSLATSYGLTETHGMATSIGGDEYLERKNSVGRPTPIVEIRVVDDKGNDVKPGRPGLILVGGPTVTPGYWGRAEETNQTVIDGWLHTGDIGYFDKDGYLYISDRAKDMIIRGGENVYCVEIENCLADHPEIVEAAVIGVPDRDLGERVKAVVLRTEGSQLNAADVKAHVAKQLAKFKVPEEVEFTKDPLPRNPAGKILKNILRNTGTVSFPPDSHL